MTYEYLSGLQADLVAENLRGEPSLRDVEISTYSNEDGAGYHIFVVTRMRESKLQGRTPAARREMEDAAISTARALARQVFARTIGREPRKDEVIVAEFIRHVLDCRVKL